MKSHTGGTMSLGKGSVIDICRKQKFNTRSSAKAELAGVDDCIGKMIWAKHFLQHQSYNTSTTLHQDNMSAIKLERNGKRSSSQRTRHLDIKYFYVTDQIEQGWLTVKHYLTKQMLADLHTKPLHGETFKQLRARIQTILLTSR